MWSNHIKNVPELRILHDPVYCVFQYLRAHRLKYLQLVPFHVLSLFSYIRCGNFEQFCDFLLEVMLLVLHNLWCKAQSEFSVSSIFLLHFNCLIIATIFIKIFKDFGQKFEVFICTCTEFFFESLFESFVYIFFFKSLDSRILRLI